MFASTSNNNNTSSTNGRYYESADSHLDYIMELCGTLAEEARSFNSQWTAYTNEDASSSVTNALVVLPTLRDDITRAIGNIREGTQERVESNPLSATPASASATNDEDNAVESGPASLFPSTTDETNSITAGNTTGTEETVVVPAPRRSATSESAPSSSRTASSVPADNDAEGASLVADGRGDTVTVSGPDGTFVLPAPPISTPSSPVPSPRHTPASDASDSDEETQEVALSILIGDEEEEQETDEVGSRTHEDSAANTAPSPPHVPPPSNRVTGSSSEAQQTRSSSITYLPILPIEYLVTLAEMDHRKQLVRRYREERVAELGSRTTRAVTGYDSPVAGPSHCAPPQQPNSQPHPASPRARSPNLPAVSCPVSPAPSTSSTLVQTPTASPNASPIVWHLRRARSQHAPSPSPPPAQPSPVDNNSPPPTNAAPRRPLGRCGATFDIRNEPLRGQALQTLPIRGLGLQYGWLSPPQPVGEEINEEPNSVVARSGPSAAAHERQDVESQEWRERRDRERQRERKREERVLRERWAREMDEPEPEESEEEVEEPQVEEVPTEECLQRTAAKAKATEAATEKGKGKGKAPVKAKGKGKAKAKEVEVKGEEKEVVIAEKVKDDESEPKTKEKKATTKKAKAKAPRSKTNAKKRPAARPATEEEAQVSSSRQALEEGAAAPAPQPARAVLRRSKRKREVDEKEDKEEKAARPTRRLRSARK